MAVITVNKNNFRQEVMTSDKPVLIDFWAEWCGPCQMMSPVVDEIAEETEDVKVCKINVDDEAELASMFGIQSIPTLVLVKDGKTVDVSVGLRSKASVLEMINK